MMLLLGACQDKSKSSSARTPPAGDSGLSGEDIAGVWQLDSFRVTSTTCTVDETVLKELVGYMKVEAAGRSQVEVVTCTDRNCDEFHGEPAMVALNGGKVLTNHRVTGNTLQYVDNFNCDVDMSFDTTTTFTGTDASSSTGQISSRWKGKDCGQTLSTCTVQTASRSRKL